MKKLFGIAILLCLSFSVFAKGTFKKSKYVLFDVKQYDVNGNLTEETWDDGYNCKYFYDENNNPVRSVQNTGITTEYKVVDEHEILETWSDGSQKMYIYDMNHNLRREYWKDPYEESFENYMEYTYKGNREVRYSVYMYGVKSTTYWNYYDENGVLVRRTNSNGDEYFLDYDYYENGKVKTRYMYELKSKKENKSIDEIHYTLTKINRDYWPSVDTDDKVLVLQYIGSTDKYKIYSSSLVWGSAKRETTRLIVFKGNKYQGHYYGINSSDMYIDGNKLIFNDYEKEYGNSIDFSKGTPKEVYVDGEIKGFAK
ncbi:MAG: hypothetical protein J6Y60_06605 [Treponema sp.]|nr:hypothetical protein [Treponema sp.]